MDHPTRLYSGIKMSRSFSCSPFGLAKSPDSSYLNHLLQDTLKPDRGTPRELNLDFSVCPRQKRMKKHHPLPHSTLTFFFF